MNNLMMCILVGAVLALFIGMYQRNYRNFLIQLSIILYQKHDPDTYLKVLNSWKGSLFMNAKTRKLMSLDAYIFQKDKTSVIALFQELEEDSLGIARRIALFQKEITYYLESKSSGKAIEANEKLKEAAEGIEEEKIKKILDDCNVLIQVYARRRGDYAEYLIKKAENENLTLQKAITYYRAAVCFYHDQDEENCRKYLLESKKCFQDTFLEKIIDPMLEQDIKLIETQIM